MTSPVLFAGQEDISFTPIGQAYQFGINQRNTFSPASLSIDPNYAASYRQGYTRSGICIGMWGNTSSGDNTTWIRSAVPFNNGSFWTSGRMYLDNTAGGAPGNSVLMRWADSTGTVRLQIETNNSGGGLQTINLQTMPGATTLATSSGTFGALSSNPPGKVDVFIDYGVSGTFTVNFNNVQVVTYSGDNTAGSGLSDLAFVDYGSYFKGNSNNGFTTWSECIVATSDTSTWSLATQVPVALGNTTTWDSSPNASTVTNNTGGTGGPFSSGGNIWLSLIYLSTSGYLSSTAVQYTSGTSGTTGMAVYTDSAGSPDTLLEASATISSPSTGTPLYTYGGTTLLNAGTPYWIALACPNGNNVAENSINGGGLGATASYASSFPSTIGTSSQRGWQWVQVSILEQTVSDFQANQSSPDYSLTATEIQEYEVTPAMPSGSFGVVSLVQHGQVTISATGPQHIEFMVRTGGTDYTSASIAPTTGWVTYANNWDTNPHTSAAWATTDLADASTSFNIGYKSLT